MEKTPVLKPPAIHAAPSGRVRGAQVECELDAGKVSDSSELVGFASIISRVRGSVSTWGFVDQGIVSMTSFLVAACVGRVCGSVELGIYSLAVKIFWLAAGIPNALVWMPYTSRAPRLNAERRRYFLGSATVHSGFLAAAIALVLLLVGFAPLPGLSEKSWFLPMCVALVPFSIMMILREHLRRMLLAHMQTAGLLLVDAPIAVLQLVILGLLVWTQRLSAVTALVGMAVGCSWGVLWIARNHDRFRLSPRRVAMHWGYNLQFGKWLLVVSVALSLGEASYYWLVESFHGLKVMGQFSAAAITVMFFNPIMLTVQNLARSILSNSYAEGGRGVLWEKTVRGTRLIAAGFGLLFSVLGLYGGGLVRLFFGSNFSGLDDIVATLCLGMYLHVLCSPVEAALAALQEGRTMLVASLLRLGLILLAGIPLIAQLGPVGVGYAMALGALGAAVYQWFVFAVRCNDAS